MARRSLRWQERDDLSGEHPLGDLGQLVFACLFLAVWLLDSVVLEATTVLNQCVPLGVRVPLGLVALVGAGYLAISGLALVFGETREPPCVIRRGVFGMVRHPIYLSEIMIYLGCLLLSLSLAAAVVASMAGFFLHHIARYEERLLRARFGEDYARYMGEVPMWLPRLRKGPRADDG